HHALDTDVDLVEQRIDEDLGGHLLQHPPVGVDEARVPPAGNPEVGVASLARTVYRAAHDGDLEGLRVGLQAPLYDRCELLDTDVVASAGGAGDHHGPSLAKTERLQNLPGDFDLLDRVGGQRDPDRVADTVHEERTDSDRRLYGAGGRRTRLRAAQVERVRDALRQRPVRADHRRDGARLDRDLEVVEVH